jgi:hypothetical protein
MWQGVLLFVNYSAAVSAQLRTAIWKMNRRSTALETRS